MRLNFCLDDHETLRELLQDISLPERLCTVKNWRTGGQVSAYIKYKYK